MRRCCGHYASQADRRRQNCDDVQPPPRDPKNASKSRPEEDQTEDQCRDSKTGDPRDSRGGQRWVQRPQEAAARLACQKVTKLPCRANPFEQLGIQVGLVLSLVASGSAQRGTR